jgi:hypothetical protein
MHWVLYSPLFILPVFLLVIAIFRLRLSRAIVGQFNVAIILLALSFMFHGLIVFFVPEDNARLIVFASNVLAAVGWLLFALGCLRLAWVNRLPDPEFAAGEDEDEPLQRRRDRNSP